MKINLQANLGYIYIHECWLMYTIPFMHTYIIHTYINTYIKILLFLFNIFECYLLHFCCFKCVITFWLFLLWYTAYTVFGYLMAHSIVTTYPMFCPHYGTMNYIFFWTISNWYFYFFVFIHLFCNWDFNLCVNTKAGLLITTSPL